jgi:hypothetical protein
MNEAMLTAWVDICKFEGRRHLIFLSKRHAVDWSKVRKSGIFSVGVLPSDHPLKVKLKVKVKLSLCVRGRGGP